MAILMGGKLRTLRVRDMRFKAEAELDGRAGLRIARGADGSYTVESHTRRGMFHKVEIVDLAQLDARCSCEWGSRHPGVICRHAARALMAELGHKTAPVPGTGLGPERVDQVRAEVRAMTPEQIEARVARAFAR